MYRQIFLSFTLKFMKTYFHRGKDILSLLKIYVSGARIWLRNRNKTVAKNPYSDQCPVLVCAFFGAVYVKKTGKNGSCDTGFLLIGLCVNQIGKTMRELESAL